MKKRFPAIILALALCLGLAVPAMATSTTQLKGFSETSQYSLAIRCPDDDTITHKMATYQTRFLKHISTDQDRFFFYDEEILSSVFDMTYVPLSADIVISGLSAENDCIELYAWSDPDGDGVYDRRLIISNSFPYSLTDSYPPWSVITSLYPGAKYSDYMDISSGYNSDHTAITITADSLYQLYGANTIFAVAIRDGRADSADPAVEVTHVDEQTYVFLLTDENVSSSFTDVSAGAFYADAVNWAVGQDITNGTSGTTFSPARNCTQAQILTFLYRAARGEGSASAEDMDLAVAWAKEKGIIGDDFDGAKDCTRSTAVSYIWQAFDKPKAEKSSFHDVDAEADYADAVSWAVANGVTNGTDEEAGLFSPDTVCTRGHIVTFLHRAYVEEARLSAAK